MISLLEQLQVVAADAQGEFHAFLLWVSLAILAALLSYACCRLTIRALRRYVDTTGRLGRVGQLLAFLATFGLVLFGGVGSGYQFYFFADSGVYDAGSYVDLTTGEITAVWTYQPEVENYAFEWAYTFKYENDTEDRGPFTLPQCDVKDGYNTVFVPEIVGAKAVTVSCYTRYVRPPAVHTNGVHDVSGGHSLTNNLGYVFPEIVIYANLEDGSTEALTPTNAPPVPSSFLLDNLYQEINQ